ncbi:peptidylprolyl isomerase [Nocardia sp. NPDC127579]|uniref:peptidylprolyl isomerase n=1 Tax=Nocardia sp. NPDC127579 TaxID=3345402 RepID=UPI00362D4A36
MPTNEQRRAAAKRKLERQLTNRAERARRRKQLTIAGSVLGVVVAVAAATGVYFLTKGEDKKDDTAAPEASLTAAAPPAAEPKADLVNCTYSDSQKPADKPVTKPVKTEVPTTGANARISMSMETSAGPIGLTLNNAESPCTVNSFVSLADQKYFDGTSCHRMTTGEGLKVLQCGDPTGTGMGGPGYQFANEYPTDQYAAGDPSSQQAVAYKRGVLAMANAGPGTNGSQFFIVYGDSELPPQYTIFGSVDENTMATLDKIAAGGSDDANGPGDGRPKTAVEIQSVMLDN